MFDVIKIDTAIEHIAEKLSSIDLNALGEFDVASKMTTALAELIKARAEVNESEYGLRSDSVIGFTLDGM